MRYERTPTDIEVTVLDLSGLAERMTAWFRTRDGADEKDARATVKISAGETGAIVDTPAGAFIFGYEGVGAGPLDDDEKWEIVGRAEWPSLEDENAYSFSMFPDASVEIAVEDIRREFATDKRVNLREYIRTFGARLDRNYDILREAIGEAGGVKVDA